MKNVSVQIFLAAVTITRVYVQGGDVGDVHVRIREGEVVVGDDGIGSAPRSSLE